MKMLDMLNLKHKLKHKGKSVLGLVLFSQLFATSTWASSPVPFNQAIANYNAGKYSQALSEFKQYAAAYPTNAQAHYYVGLCQQSVGNRSAAREEFTLVTRYSNGTLAVYAQQALQALGTPVSSPSPSPTPVAMAPAASSSTSGGKVAKVFDFYTDW